MMQPHPLDIHIITYEEARSSSSADVNDELTMGGGRGQDGGEVQKKAQGERNVVPTRRKHTHCMCISL